MLAQQLPQRSGFTLTNTFEVFFFRNKGDQLLTRFRQAACDMGWRLVGMLLHNMITNALSLDKPRPCNNPVLTYHRLDRQCVYGGLDGDVVFAAISLVGVWV